MAHRTGFGAPFELFPFAMLRSWAVAQSIERKAVPARARRLGHRAAERRVDPAVAFETAIGPNVDNDVLALIAADERCAGQWQSRIERRLQPRLRGPAVVEGFPQEVLRRADAEIGV